MNEQLITADLTNSLKPEKTGLETMSSYLNLPILPSIIFIGFNPKTENLQQYTQQSLQATKHSKEIMESELKSY
jgi:hypothetical protein